LISIVPSEGGSIEVIILINVVFPAPFAPKNPNVDPNFTPSETQFTAEIGCSAMLKKSLEAFSIGTAKS
jgi:hypothetical protein